MAQLFSLVLHRYNINAHKVKLTQHVAISLWTLYVYSADSIKLHIYPVDTASISEDTLFKDY